MTLIYARTEKEDDNNMFAIIYFESMESILSFKNDTELAAKKAAAQAIVESTEMPPITDISVVNFSG